MTRSVCFTLFSKFLFFIDVINTESVYVQLTDKEIQYLEEPYKPKDISGHT